MNTWLGTKRDTILLIFTNESWYVSSTLRPRDMGTFVLFVSDMYLWSNVLLSGGIISLVLEQWHINQMRASVRKRPYTLNNEYRVAGDSYSRLICIGECELDAILCVQEQSVKMASKFHRILLVRRQNAELEIAKWNMWLLFVFIVFVMVQSMK